MVGMPELTGGERLPHHVVFGVRCGDDNGRWARGREHVLLGGGQPWRIKVLDHLDERGRVETDQPLVAIRQRTVQQLDPPPLGVMHRIELQSSRGLLECPHRDVDPDDALVVAAKQPLQQRAGTAAEIQDPASA